MIFLNSIIAASRKGNAGSATPPSEVRDYYSVELTSPTEGQVYTVGQTLNLSAEATPISSTENPFIFEQTDYLHYFVYGQSLALGQETDPALSNVQIANNVMIGNDTRIHEGADTTAFQPLVLTPTHWEAIAAPMTNAFKSTLARDLPSHPANNMIFIASGGGQGGRTITQLSGTDYASFTTGLTQAKSIVDGLVKTISCPVLVYMQGETETLNKADYKAAAITLFERMRNDVIATYGQSNKPPVLVYQPASAEWNQKLAFLELSQEYDWILLGSPIYPVPDRSLHLDPNGSRMFGELLSKSIYQTIADNKKFEPLKPLSSVVVGNNVEVTFNKDLVLDTTARTLRSNYGFSLSGLSNLGFSVSGKVLTITTNTNLSTYGGLNLTYSQGNLRDNDSFLATTLYTDYGGTGGTVYDNIKDAQGNIIYGQPYPMWNWCIEFNNFKIQ